MSGFCSICLNSQSFKTWEVITSCGHIFHPRCLNSCHGNKCPTCAKTISRRIRIYLNDDEGEGEGEDVTRRTIVLDDSDDEASSSDGDEAGIAGEDDDASSGLDEETGIIIITHDMILNKLKELSHPEDDMANVATLSALYKMVGEYAISNPMFATLDGINFIGLNADVLKSIRHAFQLGRYIATNGTDVPTIAINWSKGYIPEPSYLSMDFDYSYP